MTKKSTKRALLSSVLALVLCFSMLLGTTFAWFTDSVTSAGNIIKSGTLDIDLLVKGGNTGYTEYTSVADSQNPIFNYDKWEPGYTQVAYAKIVTHGNLAVNYDLRIVANGTVSDLADVIDVYIVKGSDAALAARPDFSNGTPAGLTRVGTLAEVIAADSAATAIKGFLIPDLTKYDGGTAVTAGDDQPMTIVLHMQESAGNAYQDKSIGASFSFQLLATQRPYEEDSFDENYDANADGTPDNDPWPVTGIASASTTGTAAAGSATTFVAPVAPAVSGSNPTEVTFEDGALADGEEYNLTVETKNIIAASASDEGFAVVGEAAPIASIDLTLTKGDDVVSTFESGKSAIITTYITRNLTSPTIKYGTSEIWTTDAASEEAVTGYHAYYDADTGKLVFATTHFSEYVVYNEVVAYSVANDAVYATLPAAIAAADTVDTIVLLKDISATDKIDVDRSLTIDGNGHSVNSTATRGLWVSKSNVELTLQNLAIHGDNIKCERGVQVNNNITGVKLTMDNCVVDGITYYTINICNGADVDLKINNSILKGWGVINAWSANYNISIDGCELYGYNDKSYDADGWNNFGTVVLEGDTTGQTDMASSNLTVNIKNTLISAETSGQGNKQYCVCFNNPSTSNVVNLDNCELECGENCYEINFGSPSGLNRVVIDGEEVPYPQVVVEEQLP